MVMLVAMPVPMIMLVPMLMAMVMIVIGADAADVVVMARLWRPTIALVADDLFAVLA